MFLSWERYKGQSIDIGIKCGGGDAGVSDGAGGDCINNVGVNAINTGPFVLPQNVNIGVKCGGGFAGLLGGGGGGGECNNNIGVTAVNAGK